MKILVTGTADFIGIHVARRLLARGDEVIGFDVVNDYYDPALKDARLSQPEEEALARRAQSEFLRLQRGGLPDTFANVGELKQAVGWRPRTPVREGAQAFVYWYCTYCEAVPA